MIVLIVIAVLALLLLGAAVTLWAWAELARHEEMLCELSEEDAEEMTRPLGNVHRLDDYRKAG